MKMQPFIFSLCLVWQLPAVASTATFESALDTHLAAIERRDWVAFEATLTESDNLTLILPNGRMSKSTTEFKKTMRAWLSDPDWKWTYQIQAKSVMPNTAVAVLDVHYTDKNESGVEYKMHYLLSLVFSKGRGGWKLVHDQNTPLPN